MFLELWRVPLVFASKIGDHIEWTLIFENVVRIFCKKLQKTPNFGFSHSSSNSMLHTVGKSETSAFFSAKSSTSTFSFIFVMKIMDCVLKNGVFHCFSCLCFRKMTFFMTKLWKMTTDKAHNVLSVVMNTGSREKLCSFRMFFIIWHNFDGFLQHLSGAWYNCFFKKATYLPKNSGFC